MVPVRVEGMIRGYLRAFDRLLPTKLQGFYLVGSVALGAFRPARSDIDFVAVVADACDSREMRLLRALNLFGCALAARWTLRPGRRWWPAGLNGIFVTWHDLASSAQVAKPIASQRAGRFFVGRGFDMNPVTWNILARSGVTLRGPYPRSLVIYTDQKELHQWVAGNLSSYWAAWSKQLRTRTSVSLKPLLRRGTAWGVLGAPRLHATLKTSRILSKEEAGEYALDSFPQWRPLIKDALAYWRSERSDRWAVSPFERRKAAADFVAEVVADGQKLAAADGRPAEIRRE